MIDKRRDRSRRRRVVFGLVMVAAGTMLVHRGGPASASLPGVDVTTAATAADSTSSKQVTAHCPPGKELIGAGWSIATAAGRAVVTDVVPSSTNVTAFAQERATGTARAWSLAVQAVCAGPLPGGVRIVAADSATSSVAPKTVTARCRSGDVAVGTGFETLGLGAGTALVELRTQAASATATVDEAGAGSSARWYARAYAICVSDVLHIRIVPSRHQLASSATTTDVVLCPRGMTAVGAGAVVDDGSAVLLSALKVGSHLGAEYATATGHGGAMAAGRLVSVHARCASR